MRERILKNYDDGPPIEDIVQQFAVSRSTLYSYIKQRRETGNVAPKEHKRGRKNKLAPYEEELRKVIADHPDATLVDICEKLSPHVSVSTATVCDFLRYLKITRKKDSYSVRTEA